MQYKHILLIDDDEDDQQIFLTVLASLTGAIECTVFDNALDAVGKLNRQEIDPDLIFLDLNMPLMDGREFLVTARQSQNIKEIPIVVLTTTSNPVTAQEVKKLGAREFFTKPNKVSELKTILHSVLL